MRPTASIGILGPRGRVADEAALAILGHQVGGDWRRAWRLGRRLECEFLSPVNVRDEIEIDLQRWRRAAAPEKS